MKSKLVYALAATIGIVGGFSFGVYLSGMSLNEIASIVTAKSIIAVAILLLVTYLSISAWRGRWLLTKKKMK